MDAELLLRHLGVSGKLRGFRYAVYMIERIVEDPTAIFLITKILYPETAKRFGVSYNKVERDLRTVILACWNQLDRKFLEEVAGVHLQRRPTSSEFLDMSAAYLRRQTKN